ncbi:MAG: hypothetical protein ACXWLR_07120 [Myxococcales bacterium]
MSAVLIGLSCGGAGGPASGSATFSGSIAGQPFAPHDATAGALSFSANGVPGHAAVIGITSATGFCPLLAASKEPKSTQYLVLTAFRVQPDYSAVPPPSPGTYTLGNQAIENAVAIFAATDATCQLVAASEAVSGAITFTSVGSRYAGSYDLTFGSGDHVTGTFDAPVCAGAAAVGPGSGALACQ